jgi:myo-inositol-1-phosphate synthase
MIYNKELTKTNIMYDNVDFNTTNNSIHITKHIKPTKDNNLSYNEQYLDMYDGVPIRTQTTLESSLIDQIYNPNPIEPKVQSSPDWIYDEHKNSLAE